MRKASKYLLLPLLFVNVTTAENMWEMFGIPIGRSLYWMTIGMAWYVGSRSPYWRFVTVIMFMGIGLRFLEMGLADGSVEMVRKLLTAIVFVIAGAEVYGKNPKFLHKQLVVFLTMCIPIMLIQIIGVDSFFYGWVTDYAHQEEIFSLDDIGKFVEIALYPTLFVGAEDIYYQIGQGRPAGLMYANNVLSVFIAIAAGLNLTVDRSDKRLRFSDVIVLSAVVLAMAKTAYIITIFLYIVSVVFNKPCSRRLGLKSLLLLTFIYTIYYLLFPGLFLANTSEAAFVSSLLPRLMDVLAIFGVNDLWGLFLREQELLGNMFIVGESKSAVAIILRAKVVVPVLIFLGAISVLYMYRIRRMMRTRQMMTSPIAPYIVMIVVCIMTQLGVPYFAAPSFQFISGLALFPLFKDLWICRKPLQYRYIHGAVDKIA
ncbi:membrane protein of unknown function [uncultured Woeseiaceae bacterium]|uniref:O-antigen polymerase n=1 Tax=uncultured Woeseiaceae bacterium TaxID=1983305 RepID=A0A7D9H5A8_9GAMM|nr:membrane protein of unknown function [uncultured Woeseiaceae bacterium]